MQHDISKYTKEAIGNRIRKMRNKRKMSQSETCERCYMTEPCLSRLENGWIYPSVITVAKLAEVLNTSTDMIIFGEAPLTCTFYIQMNDKEQMEKFKEKFDEFIISGGNEDNDEQ